MMDAVVIEVPFVHGYRTSVGHRMSVRRERLSVDATVPVVARFDETHDVVLHDGTVVPMGRLDDRTFVRAPWMHALPLHGRSYDYGRREPFGEVDPTSIETQAGRIAHVGDRVNYTDPLAGANYAAGREHAAERIARWASCGVVVDGVPWVATMGVTVHLIRALDDDRFVPGVQFGVSGVREVSTMIGDWSPGWEPFGGWDAGALHVPDEVKADPTAVALARAMREIETDPKWGVVNTDGCVPHETRRDLRDAWSTGDPAVAAAALREVTRTHPSVTQGGRHVVDVEASMSPETFARYQEAVEATPVETRPAPDAIDGLVFGI